MNINKIVAIVCITLVVLSCGDKTESETTVSKTEIVDGITTSTFKVWGNCDMCKETIETSLKVDGVIKADWNVESKMMTVSYNDKIITLDQIQENIALVGYDNEKFKGIDTVYRDLPDCCQYDRK